MRAMVVLPVPGGPAPEYAIHTADQPKLAPTHLKTVKHLSSNSASPSSVATWYLHRDESSGKTRILAMNEMEKLKAMTTALRDGV